ncbi:predicted protein [Histoplasma capsulatum G186AR]|uniref:Uncharacterized protein n=1 Tax=Ajellomyces capsulatus (strain G186AR / H82 / ATCC MYA-2454 / RMSCC 2432) TaxID=447093 RepID=C0NKT3_AJECG|nr:uncharacterized protein HCBG_03763 [Histoplasma capsulatum G186AR]EEH08474.1 predicted protein [Histoplasma capsulatum G186AR]
MKSASTTEKEDVPFCWLRGEGSITQFLSWRGGGLEKPWSLPSSRGEGVEPVVDRASNPPGSRPAERLALADSPIHSTQYASSTASHSYSTDSTFFCSPVCGQTFSPRKLFCLLVHDLGRAGVRQKRMSSQKWNVVSKSLPVELFRLQLQGRCFRDLFLETAPETS